MRTIVSLAAILSLAVAGAILGGSGFAAAWGAEPPTTAAAAQDRLDESSSNVQPSNNPIDGPVSSADDSIIGLIGSGLGSVTAIAGMVALLPVVLVDLGFPAYFAFPIGALAQLLAGIGIIQFGINRRWR